MSKAYLIKEDDPNAFIEFEYNPETIDFSLKVNYAEHNAAGVSVKSKTWFNSDGAVWEFSNLIISSFRKKISVQPQIDLLLSLKEPEQDLDGWLTPPSVYFIWGNNRRGAAVLTKINVAEKAWDSQGYPTDCRVSFTLEEIPPKDSSIANRGVLNKSNTLTERELMEVTKEAAKQLGGEQSEYSVNASTWLVLKGGKEIGIGNITSPYFYTISDIVLPSTPQVIKTRWINKDKAAKYDTSNTQSVQQASKL